MAKSDTATSKQINLISGLINENKLYGGEVLGDLAYDGDGTGQWRQAVVAAVGANDVAKSPRPYQSWPAWKRSATTGSNKLTRGEASQIIDNLRKVLAEA